MTSQLIAGRYQVLEKVGEGGAAEVFRAMDTRLGRVVAVKLLRESYSHDPSFTQRFINEARAVARLSHPNIISLYDTDRDDGRYFSTMEYLPQNLRDYLSAHMPALEEEVRQIAEQILRGLAVAHNAGLIHRDIKPQNVLIARDGTMKITDFGIAKSLGEPGITQTGTVFGTPHYMSPEQARGQTVTKRSDLYSVGVMLYEMLAGRLPFDGDTPATVAIAHILNEPPPLREVAPHVSPAMAEVVEMAMAKDPAARFQDASEMLDALALAAAMSPPSRAASTGSQAVTPVAGASGHRDQSGEPGATVPPEDTPTVLDGSSKPVLNPAPLQPDAPPVRNPSAVARTGRTLAPPGNAAGYPRAAPAARRSRWPVWAGALLLLALLGGGAALLLNGLGDNRDQPAPGPVAQTTGTSTATVDAVGTPAPSAPVAPGSGTPQASTPVVLSGGTPAASATAADPTAVAVLLGHLGRADTLAFAPDGETVASAGPDFTVQLWNVSNGQAVRQLQNGGEQVTAVAFSPVDGAIATGANDGTVRLLDLSDGSVRHTLEGHGDDITGVAFSPDGERLVSGSVDRVLKVWRVEDGGLDRTIQNTAMIYGIVFSPNNEIVATGARDGKVRLWNVDDGSLVSSFNEGTRPVDSLAFSPEGDKLVTGSFDRIVRLWSVPDGEVLFRMGGHTGAVWTVAYAPDGETVASAGYDRTVRLWQTKTGRPLATLEGHTDVVTSVAYAPDGSVVGSVSGDGTVRLWPVAP